MIKKAKNLILSSRSKLAFSDLQNNAQLKLAADELNRLIATRFAGKKEPDQTVDVIFDINSKSKGFSVKARENALVFIAPTALEIVYAVYD